MGLAMNLVALVCFIAFQTQHVARFLVETHDVFELDLLEPLLDGHFFSAVLVDDSVALLQLEFQAVDLALAGFTDCFDLVVAVGLLLVAHFAPLQLLPVPVQLVPHFAFERMVDGQQVFVLLFLAFVSAILHEHLQCREALPRSFPLAGLAAEGLQVVCHFGVRLAQVFVLFR